MKRVREHINEAFTQNSDPVQDLNIGGVIPLEKWNELTKNYRKDWRDYIRDTFIGKTIKGKFWREYKNPKVSIQESEFRTYTITVSDVGFRWNDKVDLKQTIFYTENSLTISSLIRFTDINDENYFHVDDSKIFIVR